MPGPIYSLGAGGGFRSEGCNGERGTKEEERRNSSDLEAEIVQFLLISWDIGGRLDPEVQLLGGRQTWSVIVFKSPRQRETPLNIGKEEGKLKEERGEEGSFSYHKVMTLLA